MTELGEAGLLYEGRRVAIPADGVVLGRGPEGGLPVDSERASRRHARVEPYNGGYRVVDLGSKNGTFVNGEPVRGPRDLVSGDRITLGGETLRFVWGRATRMAESHLPVVGTQVLPLDAARLTIGRDEGNDLVLDDPNVSRFHAELRVEGERVEIADLGSANGTYVDGRLVVTEPLQAGSDVRVGPYRLLLEDDGLVASDERGSLRLQAHAVEKRAGDKQILAPTTLTLRPGRFIAVIGGSGAGKTTLVKILAGVSRPSEGAVDINGDDISLHRTSIGYVPQHEVVHGKLTVREALRYAARLRLPDDTTAAELDEVCDQVVAELGLEQHASTRVESLSGGQRRRCGVGLELLGRPSLLFLDEPTTGLDPGLEARMMGLFRDLADPSRAVVIVTHATASLALCDELVVMGSGGHLVFQGSPQEALRFFGADGYDGIYTALERRPAEEWQRLFRERHGEPAPEPAPDRSARPEPVAIPPRAAGPQARVLAARYLRAFVRDTRNLAILIGQVPLIALALLGLFDANVLEPTGSPNDAAQLLFLLVTVAIWVGSIDAAREIVKERGVLVREAAIGVRLPAYLAAKVAVLWTLVAVQVGILAGIVLAVRPLPGGDAAVLLAVLLLTGFASVAMGLLISAAARSQDQATSFVPLALVPQLFFAGAIIPLDQMSGAIRVLSDLVFARWAYAATGAPLDLTERLNAGRASVYGDFFSISVPLALAILCLFVAVLLGLAALLVRRQTRPE
jgi:ABC-type multidrug transport system ATPase subunit/pSer/pThr/pTyr-binding forkhead associated (FHA) protein